MKRLGIENMLTVSYSNRMFLYVEDITNCSAQSKDFHTFV